MNDWNTEALIDADKKFVWHPFTNMRDWCAPDNEPLVLVEGRGALLRDSPGCDRARTRNCRSFPGKFIEQGVLLRRWLERDRGRLKNRRSVLAPAKFEK